MNERKVRLEKAILLDGLVLLALAGYELFARLDAMWGPLKMFFDMAVGEKIPLSRVVKYVDMSIFTVPLFMLGCLGTGVWGMLARRSRKGCGILLPFAAALTAAGFMLRLTLFGDIVQTLKLLPLLLLCVLCVSRLFSGEYSRPVQQIPGTRFAPVYNVQPGHRFAPVQPVENERRFNSHEVLPDQPLQPHIAQQTARYHRRSRRRRAS